MKIEIQAVTFMAEGMLIQYLDLGTDVRVKGALVRQSQLTLSGTHPDYRDDIEALHARVVKVLKNALDDFEESEPYTDVDPVSDEEQILGMGGGHE